MAALYKGETRCDICTDDITGRVATELFAGSKFEGGNGESTPDGLRDVSDFKDKNELSDYLDMMDESDYSSDDYPKNDCGDDAYCHDCDEYLGFVSADACCQCGWDSNDLNDLGELGECPDCGVE